MTGSAGTAMDVVLQGDSLYIREGVRGRERKNSSGAEASGFFPFGKTRVQIKRQSRGTDQTAKQGYRSGNPGKTGVQINFFGGQNQGTDQLYWRET